MLTGSQGGEIMNQQSRFLKEFNGNRNAYAYVSNFWRSDEEPGDGHIFKPRVTQNTVQAQSSSYCPTMTLRAVHSSRGIVWVMIMEPIRILLRQRWELA